MINFKNVLKVPFVNFRFLFLVIFLGILTFISDVFLFLSLILIIFLTAGLIGSYINKDLNHFNSKTILNISSNGLIYLLGSIIFLIFQSIFSVIFLLPMLGLNLIDITSVHSLNLGLIFALLFFIILFLGVLVLEFILNIGYIKYLKTKNFEDFFKFKKYFKIIFSQNFLIGILFLIGFFALILFLFLTIVAIFTFLFPEPILNYIVGFLLIIVIYINFSVLLVTLHEIVKNVKDF